MKDHFNISHLTKLETFHDDVETSALYNSFCLFIYLFIYLLGFLLLKAWAKETSKSASRTKLLLKSIVERVTKGLIGLETEA